MTRWCWVASGPNWDHDASESRASRHSWRLLEGLTGGETDDGVAGG